jgi:gas vesicle protein
MKESVMTSEQQTQDTFAAWAAAQQKLMQSWMDTVRGFTGGTGAALWNQTLDAWQRSVRQTMDAQNEWLRRWTESLSAGAGASQETQDRVREGQEMLQRWADAQRELWDGWFQVMRSLGSSTEPDSVVRVGQSMAQMWLGTTQRLMESQAEWVRRWMPGERTQTT